MRSNKYLYTGADTGFVENQDLFRNNDDFLKILKQKILNFNLKDFIFNNYIYL